MASPYVVKYLIVGIIPMEISVILPTYKEAENLKEFVPEICTALSRLGKSFEIIIVDDLSGDGADDAAKELAYRFPIVFIQRRGKKGLASAVVEGMKRAKGDIFLVMDADGQHPPSAIGPLLSALKNCDLAVGSRFAQGGSVRNFTFMRKAMSGIAAFLASPFVWGRTSDPMSGFFAVKKDRLELQKLSGIGYKILLEILAMHPMLKVFDIGYGFGARLHGKTKLGMREIGSYLLLLSSLSFRKLIGK